MADWRTDKLTNTDGKRVQYFSKYELKCKNPGKILKNPPNHFYTQIAYFLRQFEGKILYPNEEGSD